MTSATRYDPKLFRAPTWFDATPAFTDGRDTPRDYLERCLEAVDAREPVVQAFAALNRETARAAADASTARWKDGTPLSPIDGMPVGIKDLLETKDMPTQLGCEAMTGNFPKNDNAAVWALRQAGAVIFGKTVTAELGGNHPGPTSNPFDPARTPGGSSSGSAAAVAAGFMPAAIGSQVGGSIIRPAAFCGNFALKPSQGGIHRGERQATSMSTHGPHAGSIEDMWQVAIEVASRCGGDPGRAGIQGPMTTPTAAKPDRLILLETDGWARTDADSHAAMDGLLDGLRAAGVEILTRRDNPLIESLEQALVGAGDLANTITAWENRWTLRNLIDNRGEGVSERIKARIGAVEALSPQDYQQLLWRRENLRAAWRMLAPLADGFFTFSCPGPAPLWPGDVPGQPLAPLPTGDAVFNTPSSLAGAPAVTIPMLAVNGLPVGVQVMGQEGDDARMTALARWIHLTVEPVSVG